MASFGEQLRNTNVTNIFAALQNLSATFIENGGPQTSDQPESPSEHMGHDMNHNMGHDMGHNMGHDMGHDMSQGRDIAHDHTIHEMPADHSLHAGHGGHGTDHGMATYFYFGFENVQMLFQKWIIDDLSSLLFACFILMGKVFILDLFHFRRFKLSQYRYRNRPSYFLIALNHLKRKLEF